MSANLCWCTHTIANVAIEVTGHKTVTATLGGDCSGSAELPLDAEAITAWIGQRTGLSCLAVALDKAIVAAKAEHDARYPDRRPPTIALEAAAEWERSRKVAFRRALAAPERAHEGQGAMTRPKYTLDVAAESRATVAVRLG
jgi:hypothetical protein